MTGNSARHIVCPHCTRTNRIPHDRPALKARCGACHQTIFTGRPTAVDEAAFEKHRTGNDIPILLDVWAPWCGPCQAMAPMFERAAGLLEPEVRLLKLNSDAAPQVTAGLGVRGIPALFLIQQGRVLARTTGAMDAARIVAWTRSEIGEPDTQAAAAARAPT
ncbi:thioredoxin domain-containing protein [Methylobacterium sp. P31]